MDQFEMFGGMPTKDTTLPAVGTTCARCLWQMLNRGWCDNHRLATNDIANASRRMMDLRDHYGWPVVTRKKPSQRRDGVVVWISEYRADPEWLNELAGSDPVFAERLLLWSQAQNDFEMRRQAGGAAA